MTAPIAREITLHEWIREIRNARFGVRHGQRKMPAAGRLKDFIRRTLRIEYVRWCRIACGRAAMDGPLADRIGSIHSRTFRSPVKIVGRYQGMTWSIDTQCYEQSR